MKPGDRPIPNIHTNEHKRGSTNEEHKREHKRGHPTFRAPNEDTQLLYLLPLKRGCPLPPSLPPFFPPVERRKVDVLFLALFLACFSRFFLLSPSLRWVSPPLSSLSSSLSLFFSLIPGKCQRRGGAAGLPAGISSALSTTVANRSASAAKLVCCTTRAAMVPPSPSGRSRVAVAALTTVVA